MEFKSTRNSDLRFSASEVIIKGISDDGGLFVPLAFPDIREKLPALSALPYKMLAKEIFKLYLTDFTEDEIHSCVEGAYTAEKFDGDTPVKFSMFGDTVSLLELWHGPTCAFKDMALQILPRFLSVALKKQGKKQTAVILVATSGDTGKAALEGFKDVEQTEIVVFYPEDGVSPLQKKQMTTQKGNNVDVCAVVGNFDDTQTGIKNIFTSAEMKEELLHKGMFFSSANSINFGRLLPQVVYYFYSYFELFRNGKIQSLEDKINVCVPTGNFGNILAAFYAKQMGLPVNKFICASNANNVLTDFIQTGTYDKNRAFYTTTSPSMDILVSSNLERLLYLLCGEDSSKLAAWMDDLKTGGKYMVDAATAGAVKDLFFGGYCDDTETKEIIRNTFESKNYLCDTHTAVALGVYEKYCRETGDDETPTVIASTASPYKFVKDVLSVFEDVNGIDEFTMIDRLETLTGSTAQKQLKDLKNETVLYQSCIEKDEMPAYVREQLAGWQDKA